ncbi:MAG: redox-sensing transcriptional repressor Rex [Thermoguttaceae bacterium]|nr:redox-sensing transcriptional repressor Rex [Thermoguttaceae bacterium]
MTEEQLKAAPVPSVRRLPAYLRFLKQLQARSRDVVSCTHIANELGLVQTQVRKDLAMTGIVGKPKVGYEIPALIEAIERFLGWNNTSDAFVVGAGNLGAALLGYEGFKEYGLNVLAAFDVDESKIGKPIHGKEVFPFEKLPDLVDRMHVQIGILAVPAKAAQDVANLMVLSGMRAIWNFAPVNLEVPESVIVENMNLSASLAVLSSRLAQTLKAEKAIAPAVISKEAVR